MLLITITLLAFTNTTLAQVSGVIRYVSPDPDLCPFQEGCYADFQSAFDASKDGDQIWISGSTTSFVDVLNVGDKSLIIIGGFDETWDPDTRNTNSTVITTDRNNEVFVLSDGAHLTLDSLIIQAGRNTEDGGCLSAQGDDINVGLSNVTMANCVSESSGGAIAMRSNFTDTYVYLNVVDSKFVNNQAVSGAAIYGANLVVNLSGNNEFSNNGSTAIVASEANEIKVAPSSVIECNSCNLEVIRGTLHSIGSAINATDSNVTITGAQFVSSDECAVFTKNSNVVIVNSLFNGSKFGVCDEASSINVYNSTFVSAETGIKTSNSVADIANNIIVESTIHAVRVEQGNVMLRSNMLYSNTVDISVAEGTVYSDTFTIIADPLLAENGCIGNFESPAIDASDPNVTLPHAVDAYGNERLVTFDGNTVLDIGACEYQKVFTFGFGSTMDYTLTQGEVVTVPVSYVATDDPFLITATILIDSGLKITSCNPTNNFACVVDTTNTSVNITSIQPLTDSGSMTGTLAILVIEANTQAFATYPINFTTFDARDSNGQRYSRTSANNASIAYQSKTYQLYLPVIVR